MEYTKQISESNSLSRCWSSCDYIYAYMLLKVITAITGVGANRAAEQSKERDKKVTFQTCGPLTNCISQ